MAVEQEPRRGSEAGIIRSAEVIAIGFVMIGALVTGINVLEGDYREALQRVASTAVWATFIAGGIIAAEKYLRRNAESNPPDS